jgi:hypothetical protein
MEENNFIKLDKEGRDKFHSFLNQFNYSFEDTHPRCGVDVIFNDNKDNKYAVELKNRSISTDKFPTLYLEVGKYNTLLRWKTTGTYKDVYYISYVGNKMYIYTVSKLKELVNTIGWTTKWMNAVTAESRTNKIPKLVCELPKSEAIQYTFTSSQWTKTL